MTIPGDEAAELRLLLRRVTRGLFQRRRPPHELVARLHAEPPLGRRHLAVLAHVASEGPRTVGDVARELGLSLPAASKLTRDLEDHLLIHRREHTDDRRRTVVDLNALTEKDVRAWVEQRNAPLEEALAQLTAAERAAFLKGLRALAAALMEESEGGPVRSHDRPPHRRRQHPHRPL
jgi:DNA-binding MarR family transcriptional regulator